ncbi:MAG: 4-hydroxy-tetrahydrodipicolinate synthase [Spirochaetales bacterium]|nr:4-hydroxy-tetrahydrodipicolinate synthase [Spirochaetales bacterium]
MRHETVFKGLGVALATPFHPGAPGRDSGAVDYPAYRALVRSVVSGGADFLVTLGSTGEAAALTGEERSALIRATLEEAGGVPVVAGAGHNSTREACELAARAAELGVAGLLVVTPYYNKPQGDGLEAHYRAVAEAARGTPLIVYNVPGRTGINLAPETLARLWAIPGIVAVKESSGNLAQIGEIARTLPPGKTLLAGDDALALASIAVGAEGLVSVAGNVAPAAMNALVDAALRSRMDEARSLHARLLPLMDALFAETNPVPLKAALSLAGLCSDAVRLPLAPARGATREKLEGVLAALGYPTLRESGLGGIEALLGAGGVTGGLDREPAAARRAS